MKRLVIAAVLAAASTLCTAGPATDAAFGQESDRLAAELDAGKISPLQFAQRQEKLVHTFYPDDTKLQQIYGYKTELAGQLQRNEITREQMMAKLAARADEYYAQPAGKPSAPAAAPTGPSAGGVAAATFFGVLGNSMARTAQQTAPARPTTCTSTPLGGAVSTSCY